MSLAGRSPCFANCGDPICQDHGCRHVYRSPPPSEPLRKVYVVFVYGDPMPITTCATAKLARQFATALALLPDDHPLYTEDAQVDEIPLNWALPTPLATLYINREIA